MSREQRNLRRCLLLALLAGFAAQPPSFAASPEPVTSATAICATPEHEVIEKLKVAQKNLKNILACTTIVIMESSASGAPPQSIARDADAVRRWYKDGIWASEFQLGSNKFPEADKLGKPYHFDILSQMILFGWSNGGTLIHGGAQYQEDLCEKYGFDRNALDSVADLTLFRDPFCPEYYWTYIGAYADYVLISVGPDGDSDIVPFRQRWSDAMFEVNGRVISMDDAGYLNSIRNPTLKFYEFVDRENWDGATVTREQEIEASGTRRIPPFGEIRIDPNHFYDPTNGLVSNGDVVFHRFGKDGLFFVYPEERVLLNGDIVLENLDENR